MSDSLVELYRTLAKGGMGLIITDLAGVYPKAFKENTNATIISVGGFRSFGRIEEALISKAADLVSMSRPLIRQPDLPDLWRSGAGPGKAECISCNACLPIGTAPLACRAKLE